MYNGGQENPGWFDVFVLLAPNYSGSRWMCHYKREQPNFDTTWQTTCIIPHRDRFNSRTESEMFEQDRTFTFLGIDCSIRPESLIGWIFAALHGLEASCMRIVIQWPEEQRQNRAPGPATAIVVLQTDHPKIAALHFHRNEQYDAYSHEGEGITAQEARN